MVATFVLAAAAALALPPDLEARFARIDANGDGFIASHEAWADAWIERRFRMGDVNHDGRLDREEFALLTAAARPRAASRSRT